MNRLISSFAKNKSEDIRIEIKELKGKDILDIRVYTALEDGAEKFPTGKGLVLSPGDFPDFKKAVLDAEAVLKQERLLR